MPRRPNHRRPRGTKRRGAALPPGSYAKLRAARDAENARRRAEAHEPPRRIVAQPPRPEPAQSPTGPLEQLARARPRMPDDIRDAISAIAQPFIAAQENSTDG